MFIIAGILLAAAVGVFALSKRVSFAKLDYADRPTGEEGFNFLKPLSALLLLAGLVLLAFSITYTQGARQAKVLTDWTGNVVGQSTETGLHFKAPWWSTTTFNTSNQTVTYINAADGATDDNNGGERSGPYITVQDGDGVTSNVSLSLRYSIKGDAVTDIYRDFKDEENFRKAFVEQDVRSVVRAVPTQYSTIELITKRAEIESTIFETLEERWADDGVLIDSISLQEIQLPGEVSQSYAAVQTEQNNLEAAEVKAQQQIATAQATADSNNILNAAPLNDTSLQQKYIDALRETGSNGGLIVVPEGSTPLLNVGK